jgi:ribonuclease-3
MIEELLERYGALVEEFQDILGIRFRKPELLLEAMIHKSFANEAQLPLNNERLEFLGDAVVGVCVVEYLIRRLADAPEGELAKTRSALVSRESLAAAARHIGMERFLLLGRGARREKHGSEGNLADFFEAVVGAIYLEAGFRAARAFIRKHLIGSQLSIAVEALDYKSELQAYALEKYRRLPRYRTVETRGPVHDRIYVVSVEVGGMTLGHGEGRSKKQAQKRAAREALEKIKGEQENRSGAQ